MVLGIPCRDFFENGRSLSFQLFVELFVLSKLSVDFLPMVMVIGETGIHIGKRKRWIARNDLVRAQTVTLMPEHDILHANPVPCDPWSSAADTGRYLNVLGDDRHTGPARFGLSLKRHTFMIPD